MDNLIHADCLDAMAAMDADSIDAIVTDPPYGLGFMGKAWDHGLPGVPFWAEMLRIAKPGAHLLAFGGTRTVHRLAAAIEDAGWEIRDMLVWGYASGFPKSLDVSKAIDKAAGAEREVVAVRDWSSPTDKPATRHYDGEDRREGEPDVSRTAPATPDAEKWNGWGTALKPAWEPIVLARKPLRGTVAANVLRHGTGALNIDATRIGTTNDDPNARVAKSRAGTDKFATKYSGGLIAEGEGWDGAADRWPSNVIITDPIFDGGIEGVVGGGETTSGRLDRAGITAPNLTYGAAPAERVGIYEADSGTYSRFFLIPKSARAEREPVLGGHGLTERDWNGQMPSNASKYERADGTPGRNLPRANIHPTVKPLDLMRHLVRLVTPPGGTVLDPFLGSGTTALACEMEGFAWVGIEKEADYIAITEARLNGTQRGLGLVG